MNDLNKIEILILEKLSLKYPSIRMHIPIIKVLNRKITGVGMYVNFYYPDTLIIPSLEIEEASISTNENIEVENLEYGLGYELDISNGKIKFIEFVTYGEEWDGNFVGYKFI